MDADGDGFIDFKEFMKVNNDTGRGGGEWENKHGGVVGGYEEDWREVQLGVVLEDGERGGGMDQLIWMSL